MSVVLSSRSCRRRRLVDCSHVRLRRCHRRLLSRNNVGVARRWLDWGQCCAVAAAVSIARARRVAVHMSDYFAYVFFSLCMCVCASVCLSVCACVLLVWQLTTRFKYNNNNKIETTTNAKEYKHCKSVLRFFVCFFYYFFWQLFFKCLRQRQRRQQRKRRRKQNENYIKQQQQRQQTTRSAVAEGRGQGQRQRQRDPKTESKLKS